MKTKKNKIERFSKLDKNQYKERSSHHPMMSNHFNLEEFSMKAFERVQLGNWSSAQAVVYKTHFPSVVCRAINGNERSYEVTVCVQKYVVHNIILHATKY